MIRRGQSLLLWGALVVLICVMGFSMLEACGLRLPGGPTLIQLCSPASAAPDAALRAEQRRGDVLAQQIVQLEQGLAQAPDCSSP